MVLPAQVTHLEQADYPLCQARNPAEATTHDPAGQGSNGPQGSNGAQRSGRSGSGEGRSPLLPRHLPRRAIGAPGTAVAIGLAAVLFTGAALSGSCGPNAKDFRSSELMNLVRPTLTKSAAIPILHHAMTGCPSVRPDDAPILERTGQPLPTRLFLRPPMRVPKGSAPRRRVAYRSSGLNDQAHVDRCHARGRDPRGGAGW